MSEASVILPYAVACVQGYWENYNPNIHREFEDDAFKQRNLRRMCDYIDACFNVGANPMPVKVVVFTEFCIGGLYTPHTTTEEVKHHQAITIPGPETDVLAAKAKEHNVYIVANNHENDPTRPDFFFNTAFIINPDGKIILKYRKLNTFFGCAPHDIYSEYVNPVTGRKQDLFPVVDTRIGRLACMVCADMGLPELPRIYALKGADLILRCSSGYSWDSALMSLRVRALDNTIYMASANWAGQIISTDPLGDGRIPHTVDTRRGGGSMIVDYGGNVIAEAEGRTPQLVIGAIDVMTLRENRKRWTQPNLGRGNALAMTRTEMFAPYYNRTIYPPDDVLKHGPMIHHNDEKTLARRAQALKNLESFQDVYSENSVD